LGNKAHPKRVKEKDAWGGHKAQSQQSYNRRKRDTRLLERKEARVTGAEKTFVLKSKREKEGAQDQKDPGGKRVSHVDWRGI